MDHPPEHEQHREQVPDDDAAEHQREGSLVERQETRGDHDVHRARDDQRNGDDAHRPEAVGHREDHELERVGDGHAHGQPQSRPPDIGQRPDRARRKHSDQHDDSHHHDCMRSHDPCDHSGTTGTGHLSSRPELDTGGRGHRRCGGEEHEDRELAAPGRAEQARREQPAERAGEARCRGAARREEQRPLQAAARRDRGRRRGRHRPSCPTTLRTVRATMRRSSPRLWRRR